MSQPFLGFSPATFVARRERARQAMDRGVMVLSATPVALRSRDTEDRYRPDSELFYLTGSVDPGVVAVLEGGGEGRFVLFVPPRDPRGERWTGKRLGPEEARERLCADAAYPLEDLEERLPELLRIHPRVFFRLGCDSRVESLVVGALGWSRGPGARTGGGPRSVVDPGVVLDELRIHKDPEEIRRIRQATRLTVNAFRETMVSIRPGMGEWEVEALLESAFRRGGGRGPAFPTIVGSGENACILHYVDNGDRIQDGRLVLLDGGAEVAMYSGDVTRTFPAGGRFTGRQREVYDLVLAAHQRALGTVGPGKGIDEVHQAALQEITEGLVAMGVLKGGIPDLIQEKAYEPFFPHRTSHWLGIDVHDVGDYASERGPRTLRPGMVLTLEPGLYFPPAVWGPDPPPEDHPYAGIGVRIEDDLLVTDSGVENLTEDLPVAPPELESLVGELPRG